MGEIFFDSSRAYLREHPFCISLINSLTPLRYEKGSCEALMAFARDRQPLLIASLVTGGATGPITMAGVLVLQNAEIRFGAAGFTGNARCLRLCFWDYGYAQHRRFAGCTRILEDFEGRGSARAPLWASLPWRRLAYGILRH